MTVLSVVLASIIFSIMTMGVVGQSSIITDINREKSQQQTLLSIKVSILAAYNKTGSIETDLAVLSGFSATDFTKEKDLGDGNFQVLDNGGTSFSHNSIPNYRAAIVAPYADGLDSTLSSNNLVIGGDEAYILISQSELDGTSREISKTKVDSCNAASGTYFVDNGGNPSSVNDLVSNGYIEGYKVIDEFGSTLRMDGGGNCYSIGLDKVDNSQSGDDIS